MDKFNKMINDINLTAKETHETEEIVKRIMGTEYDKFTKDEQIYLLKLYYALKGSPINISKYFRELKKWFFSPYQAIPAFFRQGIGKWKNGLRYEW